LIRRRLRREIPDENSVVSLNQLLRSARIQWHGVQLNQPDWNDYSHSIAITTYSHDGLVMYHLMLNAYQEALEFQLPPLPSDSSSGWRRIMDTFLDAPDDICIWKDAVTITESSYPVQPYSFVFLCAKLSG